MKTALFLAAALMLLYGVAFGGGAGGTAKVRLLDTNGNTVGYAFITEGEMARVTYSVTGLSPGLHAFHIHEMGRCEPPFKSAGGHFNPYGRKHGLKNPDGAHAGDLGNILVAPDGTASGLLGAPLVTMGGGKGSLFKEGGTAIVIHQGADDHLSDPAGGAGPRVACGVIEKTE